MKVVGGTDYVKSCPENERGFLEASRLAQIHVVFMSIEEPRNQGQNNTVDIPLFIRLSGGRALCIGLGLPANKQ
jgi:hypothetical protein